VLYAWGRDSGSNVDVVMHQANTLPKHLGLQLAPALPEHYLERVLSTVRNV
jgi:hypothetical protein